MIERHSFFQQILALPTSQLSYEAGRRLKGYAAERYLIETDHWAFDVDAFAKGGHCTIQKLTEIHQQVLTEAEFIDYEHLDAGFTLQESPYNSWREIAWQGKTLEFIQIFWYTPDSRESRGFLIAPDRETAEHFFGEVCKWNVEIRAEVLVFHEGNWEKDEELYKAIESVTLDDVVLPPKLKDELHQDASAFFDKRDFYKKYKIPWKRGMVMYGPPGNGKTQMIKALLNTVQKPRLYVKSLKSGCYTDQECIKRVFDRARKVAPCVLVFEDLDSLLNDENRSFFLNELDGFAQNEGILVVATTNHVERLDIALIQRPSQFDRKYYFGLPEAQERENYIRSWNARLNKELALSEENIRSLTEATEDFSFAYIKELFLSCLLRWANESKSSMDTLLFSQLEFLKEQVAKASPNEKAAEKTV